jgi:hypothetical protein
MPLNTEHLHEIPAPNPFNAVGHGWHMDDTIDAEQILMQALGAWAGLQDEHRTPARQVFYATLFKGCSEYLVRRMLGQDDDGEDDKVALRKSYLNKLNEAMKNI